MSRNYLAFDLGAESGRAILGELRAGVLGIREVRRFANISLHEGESLRWNVRGLWVEMLAALDGPMPKLDGIGVDAWGVDYALLGDDGNLVENPYCYRDRRTDGVMDEVFGRVPRERIYSATGIQFLPFNTLYQLYAACRETPRSIQAAKALLTIPDLMNYWLTGRMCSEYTIATTTQCVDPVTRGWATGLMNELDLPVRLLQPMVEAGTEIGRFAATDIPVIAPACHDTGSAVAAISMTPKSVFLSSGTWSLMGAELDRPVMTERARDLNFTNEGGVCGTVRLLKNIAGLWLLQSCKRCWAAAGDEYSYEDLTAAAQGRPPFVSLVDVDDPEFLHPENMVEAIAGYCAKTGQMTPGDPAAYTRAILESLAFKYRMVLESLEEITGRRFEEIRIVGGGALNRVLNQFTADATGRTVIAGPVEATALGNLAMQMLATGAVGTLGEARALIDRSFPTERFIPMDTDRWDLHYARYRTLLGQ